MNQNDFDEDTTLTICDRCGEEIPLAEANNGDEGQTLCNECYAIMYPPSYI